MRLGPEPVVSTVVDTNLVALQVVYLSTNVILSAISATRLAIRLAMIAYAEVTPLEGLSPATDAALGARGAGARVGVGRGLLAAGPPFARGTPLGFCAPFVRWTPLVRAGGTAAII